tara:strand:- start:1 stop:384 length:384 start_codon:yes stop_codon:yes gene_type:complete
MRKLLAMLQERGIGEEEAIRYIEKSIPYKRTWKMWKFTLYLWRRIDEEKRGIKGRTRIGSVIRLVKQPNYKRLYATFPLLKFDEEKEVKNLTQLIAEPRQSKEFISKNFFYERSKKNIPQSVIDRLR